MPSIMAGLPNDLIFGIIREATRLKRESRLSLMAEISNLDESTPLHLSRWSLTYDGVEYCAWAFMARDAFRQRESEK